MHGRETRGPVAAGPRDRQTVSYGVRAVAVTRCLSSSRYFAAPQATTTVKSGDLCRTVLPSSYVNRSIKATDGVQNKCITGHLAGRWLALAPAHGHRVAPGGLPHGYCMHLLPARQPRCSSWQPARHMDLCVQQKTTRTAFLCTCHKPCTLIQNPTASGRVYGLSAVRSAGGSVADNHHRQGLSQLSYLATRRSAQLQQPCPLALTTMAEQIGYRINGL